MNDRYRGAMLGTAVGDSLGAPVEGAVRVPQTYLDSLDAEPPRTYTDDAAMTLGIARSLVERSAFDGDHMARTLAEVYANEPGRGYGAGPPQVFRNLRSGAGWDEAAAGLFGGTGSFGNGAAMRVAPIALFAHPDTERVAHLAHQSALITHTHPEGIDGAVAQAVTIHRVLADDHPGPAGMVETVIPYLRTDVLRRRLSDVPRAVDEDVDFASALGNGIAARDSVPTALACFLSTPDSFRLVLRRAIGAGGDTDTIGAMAGALVGARVGLSGIPEVWRSVEDRDRFIQLADAIGQMR